MSAAANLAGVFPPAEHQIWNDEIRWHPIPIHTQPSDEDFLLATSKQCDRFDYEMVKFLNESNYNGLFERFKPFIDYLETKTELKLSSLINIMLLYDALNVERLNGKR